MSEIPCPYLYARGQQCAGHIVRVEAYKADLQWVHDASGNWTFVCGEPRSHYHLFCSEKGNHSGSMRADNDQMKRFFGDLPVELQAVIKR